MEVENMIETVDDARIAIMASGTRRVLDAVVQWNNTTDNGIGTAGDIWVANPQIGHWLKDDQLIEFANFLESAA